mgnify:CR=1 FL=1
MVSFNTNITKSQLNITLSGAQAKKRFQQASSFYANRNVHTKYKVEDVDFRGAGKKSGELKIRLSSTDIDVNVKQSGKRVIVRFNNTKVPGKYLRRLDVSDFLTPAKNVNVYQRGRNVEFVIDTKGDYGQFAYQVDRDFYVEVFPLTSEEIKRAKLKKEVFTGQRISFNFQNISVRSVLQLIAEYTKQNIVVSENVSGNITLRLSGVPWDQALNIIMKTQGLSKRQMGKVLLVDTSEQMTAREKAELAALEQSKELAPLLSELMQINYAKASEIAALINNENVSMLTKDRGKISVDERTNAIWIQDTAAKLGEIKELVNKLDIPVKQVLIEARIVTITKDAEQDLGIRFGVTRPASSVTGTLTGANTIRGGAGATAVPVANRLNLDLAATPSSDISTTPVSVGIALAKLGSGVLLDLELSALEVEEKGEVIATPRLITANQQEAVIESGEEIPYLEASSSGAATVAFKKAVLSLKVTPQITPDNKIILDLVVKQDRVGERVVQGVPAILTKEIETNVLVSNGQTIVLGGIYQQTKTQVVNRVPFLGSMPFVGQLFRKNRDIANREELLIFITPKIIKHSFLTS